MTSDAVRQAAATPDMNHREPEFLGLIRETKERLLCVYPGSRDWIPYLIGGSGTAAVEAMVTSLVGKGKTLILENGYYSSRIREILEVHGMPYRALSFDWLDPWDFDVIENALDETHFEAVLATHNETTTGRLNDIGRLGELCRPRGIRVLVDGMSSFGADPIPFESVDAVASSANKCLHGIPGVSFVLARPDLARTAALNPPRSYYLWLARYEPDVPPLTPPIPALAAFRQALREMGDAGAMGRHADYQAKARVLRDGLAELGLHTAIPPEETSCALTTASLPEGWSYDAWFEANYARGYVLYGTKGFLRDRYFQVANMGELRATDLHGWLAEARKILKLPD